MEDKDQILVCEDCGSRDIETMAWVKVNENDRCNGYVGVEDSDNNWCYNCQDHVSVTSLANYEECRCDEESDNE